jgi:hypothetical protein
MLYIFPLAIGIIQGGCKEGWYDGGNILVAVILAVAVSNWTGGKFGEGQSHMIGFLSLPMMSVDGSDSRVFKVPLPPKQL